MKNNFKKEVRGNMFLKDNKTYITASFFSPHFTVANFLRILLVSMAFVFVLAITYGTLQSGSFQDYFRAITITFAAVSSVTIVAGLISLLIPISDENKAILIGFLKDELLLVEAE